MGKFTFKWDKPAEEVYVTGTFDNWTKSVKLEKEGDIFQKTVDVPAPADGGKIYYKFVVDNDWVLSDSAPKEADDKGNDNNYLSTSDLVTDPPAAAILNTVTADSTTAKLAGEQPLEDKPPMETPSDIPGGFPATPANELDKPVGINPLPAADGAINPIKLEPGEKVPETVSAQGVNEHVKLDKESYEKSDALAGVDTQLPPVIDTTIPESSLPLSTGDFSINTVGPDATTAALAGQVPLEPKVPEVVKESQEKAGVDPEASAVAAEVDDKAKVEAELKEKVPEAPAAAEGTAGPSALESAKDTIVAQTAPIVAQTAPVVSQVTAAVTDAANKNLPDSVKQSLPVSVQDALAAEQKQEKEEVREEVSPEVPVEVKESIAEAHKSPEAAANTEAVQEKKEVEAELLKEVKPVPAADETKTEAPKTEEPKLEPALKVLNVEPPKIEEPKVESAPKAEEPKAAEPVNVETTNPAEVKAEAPATESAAAPAAAANGSNGTAPAATPAAETTTKPSDTASTATKKRNRVSAFFNKLRNKVSDKS